MSNIKQNLKQNIGLWLLFSAIMLVASIAGNKFWTMDRAFKAIQAAPMGQFIGAEKTPQERTIVEFMDYRCHACRNAHTTMTAVIKKHPDAKIIFRHLPVFLEPSVTEARLALAAGKQGKFVEMHERLITRDSPVQNNEIKELSREMGLNNEKLMQDMFGDDITDTLLETLDISKTLKIRATPTFVIDNIVYTPTEHPVTVEDFDKLLAEVAGK